jgi:hypothetical protein
MKLRIRKYVSKKAFVATAVADSRQQKENMYLYKFKVTYKSEALKIVSWSWSTNKPTGSAP